MRQDSRSPAAGNADCAPARLAIAISCLIAILICSCGVDERTLQGRASSGGASGASNETAGEASFAAVSGAMEEAPLPVCTYATSSVEPGCETLVKNPGFGSNVAGWNAENLGVTEGWLDADANDDRHSGSLRVMNTNYNKDEEAKGGVAGGGARQCIPALANTGYDIAADVFIPASQGAGFEGEYNSVAALSLFFYPSADCAAQTSGSFSTTQVTATDRWVHVEGSVTTPKETLSMAVRLGTVKPFRQYMFEADFDNILVRERPTP